MNLLESFRIRVQGGWWLQALMRRCEEVAFIQKIRKLQIRLGMDEREWVGGELNRRQEEEAEEVEEEEEEVEVQRNEEMKSAGAGRGGSGVCSSEIPSGNSCSQLSGAAPNVGETVSAEEMGDMMGQFTYMTHQKFLAGEDDPLFDYSKIDDDVTLDGHWLGEVSRDAEDKYFAEDEDMEELH